MIQRKHLQGLEMSKKEGGFPLRMPPEIRAWLQQAADENGRSLNSEILQRLKGLKEKEELDRKRAKAGRTSLEEDGNDLS